MRQSLPPADARQPLILWMLTDAKPGHRNQLQGLGDALQEKHSCQLHWVDIAQVQSGWRQWVSGFVRIPELPDPDWIVAAGHRTHISLLCFKRRFPRCKTVVLMTPSLPVSWFDACVIPTHDEPKPRPNVLATVGVLNSMRPVVSGRDSGRGVLLIGGNSDHYEWDSQYVIQQIVSICGHQPAVHWELTNSRRTPNDFLASLQALQIANLSLNPHETVGMEWVKQRLEQAGQVWVTRDSVSMVFESLTAGAATGLLSLPEKKHTRVVKAMDNLLQKRLVASYDDWNLQQPLLQSDARLWEAGRAADWLLERLLP